MNEIKYSCGIIEDLSQTVRVYDLGVLETAL